MGHFFRYCFPKKKQPAFIKNKKKYDAFYVPAHYCFPGRILKPLTKKRRLKQDYSLWVILLIMPSTWGHFVFFLRSKTITRSVSFFDYHIYHHPLRPVKTDSANVEILTAKEVAVCGSYWCICRRCWASFSSFPVYSKPTESFVTYFPKKRKNPHLF